MKTLGADVNLWFHEYKQILNLLAICMVVVHFVA
jgi:hypothetical protein